MVFWPASNMRAVEKNIQLAAGCFKPGIQSTTLKALRNLAEPVPHSRVVGATTGQEDLHKSRRFAKRVPRTEFCLQSLHLRRSTRRKYLTNGRQKPSDPLSCFGSTRASIKARSTEFESPKRGVHMPRPIVMNGTDPLANLAYRSGFVANFWASRRAADVAEHVERNGYAS